MPADISALPADYTGTLRLQCALSGYESWIPVVATSGPFPLDVFLQICREIVLHPERSSTSILRADVLQEEACTGHITPVDFEGYALQERIIRRILPARHFDAPLDQDCISYVSDDGRDGLVILLPRLSERVDAAIPYYHPKVAGLAFRYIGKPDMALIQLDVLPLEAPNLQQIEPNTPYYSSSSRIHRTALQLLAMLHKHGMGLAASVKYEKRVHHDSIVPRTDYQDLYRRLKKKYTWIVDEWKEGTDPVKHVFEDVGIATFLICLWKDLYREHDGRPPSGFVDIGCGNGLLVYLLNQEGFPGYGVDLRARKSWSLWTGSDLRTMTISPPELCLADQPPFPSGSFLIGNHADELTPWLPLLAARTPSSAFLNIPCCCHRFTSRFTDGQHKIDRALLDLPGMTNDMERFESLASEKGGRYNAYLRYIAEQTIRAGWRPEREALRIPSTKCWAFVGRRRVHGAGSEEENEVQTWVRTMAQNTLSDWQPRKPETDKEH